MQLGDRTCCVIAPDHEPSKCGAAESLTSKFPTRCRTNIQAAPSHTCHDLDLAPILETALETAQGLLTGVPNYPKALNLFRRQIISRKAQSFAFGLGMRKAKYGATYISAKVILNSPIGLVFRRTLRRQGPQVSCTDYNCVRCSCSAAIFASLSRSVYTNCSDVDVLKL